MPRAARVRRRVILRSARTHRADPRCNPICSVSRSRSLLAVTGSIMTMTSLEFADPRTGSSPVNNAQRVPLVPGNRHDSAY